MSRKTKQASGGGTRGEAQAAVNGQRGRARLFSCFIPSYSSGMLRVCNHRGREETNAGSEDEIERYMMGSGEFQQEKEQ